jgi:hypothetical protein
MTPGGMFGHFAPAEDSAMHVAFRRFENLSVPRHVQRSCGQERRQDIDSGIGDAHRIDQRLRSARRYE